MPDESDKKKFEDIFDKAFHDSAPNFDNNVNIAVVGKVSSGKSSLINAILERTRDEIIAEVGAQSGVTTKVTAYRLDSKVLIVDCPGLDDVRAENSEATKSFLKSIDFALFVVTGSVDSAQKANFEDVTRSAKKVAVVVNKIDEWDNLEESAVDDIISQWKSALSAETIFRSCAKGFDPKSRKSSPMDLRGIDEIRQEIFNFLKKEGKDILLARHLKNKDLYATRIILGALATSAGAAFLPGSAAYITAAQVAAIMALYYLYTGDILSKASALGLLPQFFGRSIGTNLFLWVKSFMPPTGILDVAAAGIALTVTFAMLASVKCLLENGYSLDDKEKLKSNYDFFEGIASIFKNIPLGEFRDLDKLAKTIAEMLSRRPKPS